MTFAAHCVRAALATALAMGVPLMQGRVAAQEAGAAAAAVSREGATVDAGAGAGARAEEGENGWVVISTPNGHRLVRVSPNWRGARGVGAPPVVATGKGAVVGEAAPAAEPERARQAPVLFGPVSPPAAGRGATAVTGAGMDAPTRPQVVGGEAPENEGPRPLLLGTGWAPEQAGLGTTAPAMPGGLLVQPSGDGGIHVSWEDLSTNETAFEVMRQRKAGPNWNRSTTLRVEANTTALVDRPGNGEYRYRVRAVNGAGASEFTPWAVMQVVGMAPAAPSQVSAADLGNGSEIRITWADNSADETGFEIQRETQSGSQWKDAETLTASANQTSYTDLVSVGTYRYRVRAVNSAGASAYSPWATVTVAEVTPAAPTNVQAADQGNGWHLRVTWTDNSSNESGFQIERQKQEGGVWGRTFTIWVQANVSAYMDTVGAGTYRYRVRAMNAYGASPFTPWTTATVASASPTAPAAPTGTMASDIGNRRALVSWTDNSDNETGFEIERSPAFPGGTVRVAANVVGYIDQSGAGEFSYRVRAINDVGASAYSSWANVTVAEIAPAAPSNLQAVAEGNDGVRLTWTDNSDNETGFRIERQTQRPDGSWGSVTTLTAVADATTLVDQAGQGTHRYRVAATNFAGDSPFTPWVTIGMSGGWTVLTPSPDTRIIYVSSSSGNDSNDGLSPDRPVRTLGRGVSLLRSGYPDWLLLKRGDVFYDRFANFGKSGRSPTEKMVIGAYGDSPARPIVQPGAGQSGFEIAGVERHHLAIVGIHFRAPGPTTGTGIRIINDRGSNVLIEDCMTQGFLLGIHLHGQQSQGGFNNVQVRRCVIVDAFSPGGAHSQGAYVDGVNGLLVEECLFDQNGWKQDGSAPPTIFNHNLYVQDTCGPAVIRGNIFANGSSHGCQLRPGGVMEYNVFVRNALALTTSRSASTVRYNVVLEGRDIDSGTPRGMGIEVLPQTGGIIEENIVSTKLAPSSEGWGIQVGVSSNGVSDYRATIRNNIVYRWGWPCFRIGTTNNSDYRDIRVENNIFQEPVSGSHVVDHRPSTFDGSRFRYSGNRYYSQGPAGSWMRIGSSSMNVGSWRNAVGESNAVEGAASFPDPNRTLATYNATLGGPASYQAFIDRCRQQSKMNWDSRYTAREVVRYIRAGFGRE